MRVALRVTRPARRAAVSFSAPVRERQPDQRSLRGTVSTLCARTSGLDSKTASRVGSPLKSGIAALDAGRPVEFMMARAVAAATARLCRQASRRKPAPVTVACRPIDAHANGISAWLGIAINSAGFRCRSGEIASAGALVTGKEQLSGPPSIPEDVGAAENLPRRPCAAPHAVRFLQLGVLRPDGAM